MKAKILRFKSKRGRRVKGRKIFASRFRSKGYALFEIFPPEEFYETELATKNRKQWLRIANETSATPVFFKHIFQFREKWGLPKKGFKDEATAYSLTKGIIIKPDKFIETGTEFVAYYRGIKIDLNEAPIFELGEGDRKEWRVALTETDTWRKSIQELLDLHSLSWIMFYLLEHFILCNEWDKEKSPPLNLGLFMGSIIDREKEEGEELFIRLTGSTTKQDIEGVWSFIEELQQQFGDYRKRSKPWIKQKRDEYIFKLYSEGKEDKEIWDAVCNRFGEDLSFGSIRKVISNFKKRFGISPFPRDIKKKDFLKIMSRLNELYEQKKSLEEINKTLKREFKKLNILLVPDEDKYV